MKSPPRTSTVPTTGGLTDEDGSDLAPAWSPDGSKIAFVSNRRAGFASKGHPLGRGALNVYIMDADGLRRANRSPRPLPFISPVSYTHLTGLCGPPMELTWPSDNCAHCTLSTSNHFQIVSLGRTTIDPAWSPDGEWITFVHVEPDFETFEGPETLYVTRPDGSETREVLQLSDGSLFANIAWSPDGSTLRFYGV